ncbi:zinc-dependent metalloprotease [Litoribacter alkaliphilus]|uniref:Zinc-dependent metalloprotease n=1 Tax=Litoribacter ruber TaxID=702568 RepID=A0AAP2G5P7_9BACT|nr:zinc-dependent metalloprotease [Litoribacter alkaliphilus]MBS9525306.1 zinc-dependent metalloprotease [Litoribacter alkaliphilus]
MKIHLLLLFPLLILTHLSFSLKSSEGFINMQTDEDKGKIFLEIDDLEKEFLYVNSLPAGIGSNDLGMDRGQLGNTRVVEFRKAGNKILLVHKNLDFRAESDNEDERKAVQDAFAESVLWGFEIQENSDGKYKVDATSFFLQDAHQIAEKLGNQNQGTYKLESSRSALNFENTKNFPQNTEVEAYITVTGTPKGSHIRSVTPSPEAVTVRQRHSFIELPDENYKPRKFDPRAGYFSISYMDFATPINQSTEKRFISRHRLEKKNPEQERSEAVEPIIYYLDRGTPEPIRSALIEGGNWWNDAFEAAGFQNAFRVELLPEGADPMDVRYNMIQWVHRSTRGWSYGASVRDPRTGEIIKGHVTLGSLRVRQDYLIAQGLLQPFEQGAEYDSGMLHMALDRLRQLSAHEIGHTLGLSHNYAASPNMSSVMDYPYPQIDMESNGKIDLSNAYDQAIGNWDKVAIRYGYAQFGEGKDEEIELDKILIDAAEEGLEFIADMDARHPGGSHPRAHLWDNQENPAEELSRLLTIRKRKLEDFGLNALQEGRPVASLEEVLVPLYLMHRYQIEAASKLLGGVDYTYQVKGDNQKSQSRVEGSMQRQALDALLATLSPEHLVLPGHIADLIPPRPMGFGRSRETFSSRNALNFDPAAPAENVAKMTLGFLFHPARANRLYQQHLSDNSLPSFQETVDKLTNQFFESGKEGWAQEINMINSRILVEELISLAKSSEASASVRAITRKKLEDLYSGEYKSRQITKRQGGSNYAQEAHDNYLASHIHHFLSQPEELTPTKPLDIPAGAPIGQDDIFCW